jgi:hypothetical protein
MHPVFKFGPGFTKEDYEAVLKNTGITNVIWLGMELKATTPWSY